MRSILRVAALVLGAAWVASATPEALHTPDLICNVGPLQKTYAKSLWLVYACNDPNTIQIVTDQGNWAKPFYFSISIQYNGDVTIFSKSTGGKPELVEALNEIHLLKKTDVLELMKQARDAAQRMAAP